jgi:hypothetical protein
LTKGQDNFTKETIADCLETCLDSWWLLTRILTIGLISFVGSHVSQLAAAIYADEAETPQSIPLAHGYEFTQRNLACLDQFIGGGTWVSRRTDITDGEISSGRFKVSITVEQFADLWGPVWFAGTSLGPVLRTERGFIYQTSGESAAKTFPKSNAIGHHTYLSLAAILLRGLVFLPDSTNQLVW